MDAELERLYVALDQAERDWREHRQSAWKVWQGEGEAIGTATANPWTREYWERHDELKGTFEAALQAWRSHLPTSG
jgi:hypothetical protein